MKKIILLFLVFIIGFSVTAQVTKMTKDQTVEFIKDYYSNYKTGYDVDEKYHLLSNNYKVTIEGCNFKISFDEYDHKTALKKKTKEVQFNFSEIKSIEPTGDLDYELEIGLYQSTYGCLQFHSNTTKKKLLVNIEYEPDADVTKSGIYIAFERLLELCNKTMQTNK